jgi:multiple antibiotic resistance protein
MLTDAIGGFLLAFSALLSIVNPFAGALIYSQVTAGLSIDDRSALAWRVALYSGIVMLTALWFGTPLLSFFGISLAALRIAGGFVVAARAWEMLSGPEVQEDRKQQQVAPAGDAGEAAFYPLTMPFTTGPGTISVAIALSANGPPFARNGIPFFSGASLAAVSVAVLVGICYASADRIVSIIGKGRSRVFTRLTAFILLCIGVQIALTGVQDILVSLAESNR